MSAHMVYWGDGGKPNKRSIHPSASDIHPSVHPSRHIPLHTIFLLSSSSSSPLTLPLAARTHSVPAQAILRHDRIRNPLLPHTPPIAPSTPRALPTASTTRGRIPPVVRAGHEITSHATRSLCHLARRRHRAGALVARALLAVAPSDADHGGSVEGCAGDGADSDTDGAAFDLLRAAGVSADGGTVACGGGCGSSGVGGGGSGALVEGSTGEERNGRVHHVHQSLHRQVGVLVEVADSGVYALLHGADHVGRDVRLRQCRDEAHGLAGVVRHQCIHLDLVIGDAQTVRDTLRQIREDLRRGVFRRDHEGVVQAVVEADLNQCRVLRSLWHSSWRLDETRHVCWQTCRSSRSGRPGLRLNVRVGLCRLRRRSWLENKASRVVHRRLAVSACCHDRGWAIAGGSAGWRWRLGRWRKAECTRLLGVVWRCGLRCSDWNGGRVGL